MWHDEPEVMRFLAEIGRLQATPRKVVELGSWAMHDHNPRALWPTAKPELGGSYVGIDWREGPGVDLVGLAHDRIREAGPQSADLVLSISALEHDPHWRETLRAAVAIARPGGLIAVTCAGPGWQEHELECAPEHGATNEPSRGWYRNVTMDEIVSALVSEAPDRVLAMRGWYEQRTMYPHWLRSCAWVRLASGPLG